MALTDKRRTDTERLDYVIKAFMEASDDVACAAAAGAMLMGLSGREAIDAAMNGTVPPGVIAAAIGLRE